MVILFIIIIAIIAWQIAKAQNEREEEEKQRQEKIQKEKHIKRENDILLVKQFAKSNNVDIGRLLEDRNSLLTSAIRNYATGKLTMPLKPSTVKPVYRGNAIAEYTADQMNKERQTNYNDSLSSSNDLVSKGLEYRTKCKQKEGEILRKLKRIPENEEYIEILQRYFAEDDKVFL